MDRIAFVVGENFIYWNSIFLTLGAGVAICFFLSFYIGKCGNAVAGFAVVPLSIVLSLVLARFFHWYSRSDSYAGFLAAMTDYTSGGYTLLGVFAGCDHKNSVPVPEFAPDAGLYVHCGLRGRCGGTAGVLLQFL